MASKPPLQKRVSSFGDEKKTTRKPHIPKAKMSTPIARSRHKVQGVSKPEGSRHSNYSKEAEEKFDVVLEGNLNNIPSMPRSTVRIFLSSTFSDMRAERNALARDAYPQLRDFCSELGLSFQVVDLRWGVTSEVTNNHLTTKICLLELDNCQKVSLGPNCIAIIGSRYGFCPLPYSIQVEEYTILRQETEGQGSICSATLDTWYKRDDNVIPSAYFLQPISSLLPYFLDNSPDNAIQKQTDMTSWAKVENLMLKSLHKAAKSAHKKGKMSADRLQSYLISVTEHEVRNGIMLGTDPQKHGLVFLRDLDGLDEENFGDDMGSRYLDMDKNTDGQVEADALAANLLNTLKTNLNTLLPKSNVMKYEVPWVAGGIQPDKKADHNAYIKEFCRDFVNMVKDLILKDKLAKESLIRQKNYYSIYSEVLHHVHFCQDKCKSFCGQDDTLNKIKDYILDPNNRQPFVVHAQSGAGKTSVMAMAMKYLDSWIKEPHIGMIRFLGTSPFSTDIYCLLRSVCGQVADNADVIMEPHGYKTMKGIAKYMPRFFRAMANNLKRPVIIFLDSLDQLESRYDAYSCWWLPTTLPTNFKLIVSTLPKQHGILNSLKQILPDESNYKEIPVLPPSTSQEIIHKYLSYKDRTITNEQMSFLTETFQKSPSPLYLKLLMDQSLFWTSSSPVSDLSLPDTVRVAINNLFAQLEQKFGVRFVEGALGLITVGLNGLGEIELEDALSCMDDVLIEIYKHHDPPVPGMVRIPPVMWARIRYDIQEYLVERQSQGQTTLYWYHRQFIEAASDRYTQDAKGQLLHRTLFEYFAAENGVQRDITLTQRKGLHITDANRNTTPQPTTASNSRKLECITYHLKHCAQTLDPETYKRATYCNLTFLRSKVQSIGVSCLIQEIEDFLKTQQDREVEGMLNFINICKNALRDPTNSAFSLLAFLQPKPQDTNIAYMSEIARNYLLSMPKTRLIPTFAFLSPRQGEPVRVYDSMTTVLYRNNETLVLADIDVCENIDGRPVTLGWLDIQTTDMNKVICDDICCNPYVTPDGKLLVYLSAGESTLIKVSFGGQQTSLSLSELTGKLFEQCHLSRFDCIVSGSFDSKLLLVSVGGDIAMLSIPHMNRVGSFTLQNGTCITNLHYGSGFFVASGMIQQDGNQSVQGFVAILDSSLKKVKHFSETCFEIVSGTSAISPEEDYHVCYGKVQDNKYSIEIRKIKLGELLQPIIIGNEVRGMKVSTSDPQAMFLIGDSTIQLLNLETSELKTSLKYSGKIVAWDISWEEENIVVIDFTGFVTLFAKNSEIISVRKGQFGDVRDISIYQNQMMILTADHKVQLWSVGDFFSVDSTNDSNMTEDCLENTMASQKDIRCFVLSHNSRELFTLGNGKICKIWSLADNSFIRQFPVKVPGTEMFLVPGDKLIIFDSNAKQLLVYNSKDGSVISDNLPHNIMCLTFTKYKDEIIFMSLESKPVLYKYDIQSNSSCKKFPINIYFQCVSCMVQLTPSERYAVLKIEVTQHEYMSIATKWTKGQNLPSQRHPYRFVAVDLSQSTGSPLYAFHRLTKIPHLGVTMEPYLGNSMMLTCRRWVIFWDIPTGSCDQTMCKATKKTKMYRPDWLGKACIGSNDAVCMSKDQTFVAIGSQDGYLFVYGADSGMPVGMTSPTTRHPSPVVLISITPSGSLIASSCTSGHLMLWEPSTGQCLFSTSLGMELQHLDFTNDGNKLVALTASEKTHLIVFDVKMA